MKRCDIVPSRVRQFDRGPWRGIETDRTVFTADRTTVDAVHLTFTEHHTEDFS